jgi:lysine 2,3-aminomutase
VISVEEWKTIYKNSLTDPDEIARAFSLKAGTVGIVAKNYPAMINSYYLSLIEQKDDSLYLQVVPDGQELSSANLTCPEDPICEDSHSPVPNLTHRYPDRVLFLISPICPVYCRFCTRKRKVGGSLLVNEKTISQGIAYIRSDERIRDVLLSGGDPLMLEDEVLEGILNELRGIGHVEIIRIGTRVPGALPHRITPELARTLARHHPVYIHTHFNHPREVTCRVREACSVLADAGIPMSSQTVLLKGVNDNPDILESLFRSLLTIRIRPYYLFHVDNARGADHFRTTIVRGLELMDTLRSRTSNMALPHYAVDLPDGMGKVILTAGTVRPVGDGKYLITTPDGKTVSYSDPECSVTSNK